VRNVLTRRHDERVADGTADERVTERRDADQPTLTKTRTAVTERPAVKPEPTTEVVERPRWAHVSALATVSLIVGVAAIAATLTGLLAPEGAALGVIGGALAAGGLVGASRRGVTGHSVALLGLVASIGAILLGVLAISGQLSWLDSSVNEVTRLHNWIDVQAPWLKRW
jgi:hypothetical protein